MDTGSQNVGRGEEEEEERRPLCSEDVDQDTDPLTP